MLFKKLMFKKKKLSKQEKVSKSNTVLFYEIVLMNDNVEIIHDCAIACYNTAPKTNYMDKTKYIGNLIKAGHESVIEHSNIIMTLVVPKEEAINISQVLVNCRYLLTKLNVVDNNIILVIAGSIRGYKHLFREAWDLNNPILRYIKKLLGRYIDNCFFNDFIEDGIFEEVKNKEYLSYNYNEVNLHSNDIISFLNVDSIEYLNSKIGKYGFTFNDLLDLCTITIKFDHMSRIVTQQATRHRCAITQMSQRYVDFSEAVFNSPHKFKDKYDAESKFSVVINGQSGNYTLEELGTEVCSIYGQLLKQGIDKEDARGYLPQNVDSGYFYMTFTFKNLLKFLNLRCDSHSQPEIKIYADVIAEQFLPYIVNCYYNMEQEDIEPFDYKEVIKPIYKNIDKAFNNNKNITNVIDETIDNTITEEVVDAFEGDITYDPKDYI